MFWDNLYTLDCPEMQVKNYHYTMHNFPEERRFYHLNGEFEITHICALFYSYTVRMFSSPYFKCLVEVFLLYANHMFSEWMILKFWIFHLP